MSKTEAPLDLADIQGNILRSYGFRHGAFVFVRVRDAEVARRWLGALPVTSAAPWSTKPAHALNVAFSHGGLAALGVPAQLLTTFPDSFRDGMGAQAEALGDVGPSACERWEDGLRGEAHIVVAIHARDPETSARRFEEVVSGVAAAGDGLDVVAWIECHNREGQREHFGFADGAGQPEVEGIGGGGGTDEGPARRHGGLRPLKAGEFVLGYEDEDGVRPASPAPPLGDNGSYMVLRKLAQNVAQFRRYVTEKADELGLPRELFEAKLVGRWQDGTPLVLSPDRPDPRIAGSKARMNDFLYRRDDPDGFRCPIGSHIRRVNPRDAMDPHGLLANRHRMIRRGMPYGKYLPEGVVDDNPRGLVFVCYVASIERQFEFVQSAWCNDGDNFHLGVDRDVLVGRGATDGEPANKITIPGRTPLFAQAPRDPFVVTRGGGYFFAPGIRALRAMTTADW